MPRHKKPSEPFLRWQEGTIRTPLCDVSLGVIGLCEAPADWVVTLDTKVRMYYCSECLQKSKFKDIADLDNVAIPEGTVTVD